MEAKSTNRKTFELTDNGQLLGELTYDNLFSFASEIRLPNAAPYEIKPVGFFGTSISVIQNETELASLKMNWRGQIVMAYQDGREYILKAKGLFMNKFTIENQQGESLMQFDPKFDWGKFNYNYSITYDNKPTDLLLVLLGVYAFNYVIATTSGAV